MSLIKSFKLPKTIRKPWDTLKYNFWMYNISKDLKYDYNIIKFINLI
jgi:hypothetical protein